jgi:hypothetical protein
VEELVKQGNEAQVKLIPTERTKFFELILKEQVTINLFYPKETRLNPKV